MFCLAYHGIEGTTYITGCDEKGYVKVSPKKHEALFFKTFELAREFAVVQKFHTARVEAV